MSNQLKTPVAFLVFNRPDTTEQVFAAIRQAQPETLLVVADGPRPARSGEADVCQRVRKITEQVDWSCRVLRNYSDINLGCKERISSGLDWVFSQVEEAIILEDDCLPHPSFFPFCEKLLEYYRNDEQVMMISGDNFLFGRIEIRDSYYFSRYPHIWGWATWRRSWKKYDVAMGAWPDCNGQESLLKKFPEKAVRDFWRRTFADVYNGLIDTWDFQLVFATLTANSVCIIPKVNLVSNIGFGAEATRTTHKNMFAEMAVSEMAFPLEHPLTVERCAAADRLTEQLHFSRHSRPMRFLHKLWKRIFNGM